MLDRNHSGIFIATPRIPEAKRDEVKNRENYVTINLPVLLCQLDGEGFDELWNMERTVWEKINPHNCDAD
jgi:hypothetical protein